MPTTKINFWNIVRPLVNKESLEFMKKVIIGALLLTSCNDLFYTHPYNINFDGETGINAKRIAKNESRFADLFLEFRHDYAMIVPPWSL